MDALRCSSLALFALLAACDGESTLQPLPLVVTVPVPKHSGPVPVPPGARIPKPLPTATP